MGRRGRRPPGHHRRADGHEVEPEAPAEAPSSTLRGPGEGRADRRRAAKRIKRRRRLSVTKEIPILVGIALVIALVLKTFLVQAFVIPSGSMEQTIRIGDRVLVDKLTPWFGGRPERGDVVVFEDPGGWLDPQQQESGSSPFVVQQFQDLMTFVGLLPSEDEQDLIKRVVAVGGDRVQCCDAEGRVTVNGTPIDEPYLYPGDAPSKIEFDVTVPEGRVFVMGDHRGNSADSRYHLDSPGRGTVPEELIVGRAMVVAWPVDHWQQLSENETFTAVPDPSATGETAQAAEQNRRSGLPGPVELSLVVTVVGLARYRDRRERSVRSESGGHGRRCAVRSQRFRGRGPRRVPGDE